MAALLYVPAPKEYGASDAIQARGLLAPNFIRKCSPAEQLPSKVKRRPPSVDSTCVGVGANERRRAGSAAQASPSGKKRYMSGTTHGPGQRAFRRERMTLLAAIGSIRPATG
jgi:hypothetical protein